jgi:hypothetical protein
MENITTIKSIREMYGLPEKKVEEEKKPKSKYYKLGEKIARDAIKKVEEKERERSCFDKWNV